MPTVTDIRRVLRDHVRFTGDGQPNAPVGAPLPVGDPRSGMYNLDKYEIRELLTAILQTQGDAGALQEILTEVAGKADLANSGPIFPDRATAVSVGQENLPAAIRRIVTEEGNFLVLRAPFSSEPDPLFATSPYWGEIGRFPNVRLLDEKAAAQDLQLEAQSREAAISSVNRRAISRYESRGAAVAAVPTLPTEVSQIFVQEGQSLVLRTADATSDALFEAPPRWGVSATYPEAETVISPIKGLAKDAQPAWGRAFGRGDAEQDQAVSLAILGEGGKRLLSWDRALNPILNYGVIFGRGDAQPDLPPLALVSENGVLLNPGAVGGGGVPVAPGINDLYDDPDYDAVPFPDMWYNASTLYAHWDALVAEFPNYVSRSTLGQDGLGNPIHAYAFTPRYKRIDAPYDPVALRLPKIILQGGLHGNERNAKKGVLTLARNICRNWRKLGGAYEALRFGARLVIIPASNPSGENGGTRGNHNGVDLNRNFAVDWDAVPEEAGTPYYKGPSAASEVETRLLQNLPSLHPDACAILDSHEHAEAMMFWYGTPTPALVQPSVQVLDKLTAWFRRELAPATGDDITLAKINATPPGSGTMYYHNVAGVPALLCEAASDRFHPAYSGAGGNKPRAIAAEVALVEALMLLLTREQARRIQENAE